MDRELYLPQVWAEDRERLREAGVPDDVPFRTKPQLARLMLERALETGVPFGRVAGDEVYGSGLNPRLWLEREGLFHSLAIMRSEKLWALTGKGPRLVWGKRRRSCIQQKRYGISRERGMRNSHRNLNAEIQWPQPHPPVYLGETTTTTIAHGFDAVDAP